MKFKLYTDGASSPQKDHKMGGWGYVIIDPTGKYEVTGNGFQADTTNQRMEMLAIIEGLQVIKGLSSKKIEVDVVSDSMYCIDGITEWVHKWRSLGWRKVDGPVKNLDLWKSLYDLVYNSNLLCAFSWVKGHSGDHYNEIADNLATIAKKQGIEAAL